MNQGNSYILNIIFIILGALLSYVLCQFNYLQLDPKINIINSLISTATVVVGLYIAISLKKNQTKSSNLHSYLQPKLDLVWNLFLNISHKLSLNDKIELVEISKSIKEINQNLTPLKKMFYSFKVNNNCIEEIETRIENLESFLVDECKIEKNIIFYYENKDKLRIKLDEIHSFFAESLKIINNIS